MAHRGTQRVGVLKFSLGTPRVSGNIGGRPETLSLSVVEFYLTVDIFLRNLNECLLESISIAHRSLLSIVILVSFITFSTRDGGSPAPPSPKIDSGTTGDYNTAVCRPC